MRGVRRRKEVRPFRRSFTDRTGRTRDCFAGRESERTVLSQALSDTLAGKGHIVLLQGPSGIGKTRLAEEACDDAEARGFRSAWGRCSSEQGVPPFWPWIRVVARLSEKRRTGAT